MKRLQGLRDGAVATAVPSTSFQLLSGSKVFITFAIASLSGPRSRSNTAPSWLITPGVRPQKLLPRR